MSQTFERCTSWKATSPPQQNRNASISSLLQNLDDIVCADYLFLGNVRLFHAIDMNTCAAVSQVSQDSPISAHNRG